MSYWQMDDGFLGHHKTRRALRSGAEALQMWMALRTYVALNLTDGFIPDEDIDDLPSAPKNPRKWLGVLVECGKPLGGGARGAGLVDPVERGWLLHDYQTHGLTKAEIQQRRETAATRAALRSSPELMNMIKARDMDRCRYCGVKVDWKDRRGPLGGTYDHVLPITRGGTNSLDNVVVCCRGCNSSKQTKTLEEFGMKLLNPTGSLPVGNRESFGHPSHPIPSHDLDLAKAAASAQDLTASARVEPPKPRQQRQREFESEPNPEHAQPPRHAASGPPVAAPGRAEQTPTSERQPDALPTRRQRHTSDLEALPIGELAKRWKANPTWVEESSPQARPELVEATRAWEVAVGLAHRQLGRPSRDSCTKALLELHADGVPHADIMRACAQVAKDGWICGREPGRNGDAPRKRRIDCLSHAVLRRLLDAADAARPSSVNPRVAAILDEFTPEKTA